MTAYRVHGVAHGSTFDERGFTSWTDATDYASSVMDGDIDSTIEVGPDTDEDEDEAYCYCGHTEGSHVPASVDAEGSTVPAHCLGCFENDEDDELDPEHPYEQYREETP